MAALDKETPKLRNQFMDEACADQPWLRVTIDESLKFRGVFGQMEGSADGLQGGKYAERFAGPVWLGIPSQFLSRL